MHQTKLVASDGAVNDYFGKSDGIIVGATINGKKSGSVYLIFRNGSTWTHQAKHVLLMSDGIYMATP